MKPEQPTKVSTGFKANAKRPRDVAAQKTGRISTWPEICFTADIEFTKIPWIRVESRKAIRIIKMLSIL